VRTKPSQLRRIEERRRNVFRQITVDNLALLRLTTKIKHFLHWLKKKLRDHPTADSEMTLMITVNMVTLLLSDQPPNRPPADIAGARNFALRLLTGVEALDRLVLLMG
jgi:hypothetical protein